MTIETRHQWRIGSDRRRWLPAVDPENREMLLAIGAFLENLIVAAKSWGYEVDYRVIATTPFDPDLIAISLRSRPHHCRTESRPSGAGARCARVSTRARSGPPISPT
ncbi:MAG: hypothetical protein MZV49_05940 [Rhodopseudomonas palustris]|nr:hypothetical protein [Rhodopseudomonas palustris]